MKQNSDIFFILSSMCSSSVNYQYSEVSNELGEADFRDIGVLYSAANDPQTGNDPQIRPQMTPNRK